MSLALVQHQLLRMHLFGSALRDDFDPSRSDLDLLVEFQPIEPGALVQAYLAGGAGSVRRSVRALFNPLAVVPLMGGGIEARRQVQALPVCSRASRKSSSSS
jgi:hypothetical protein